MLHKNSCTNIAVVLLVSLLVSGTAVAQSITNYTFVPSSGTFTPLVGANIPALSGGSLDDGYYNDLPIGFTFNYLGDGYTAISATTNGCAVLGGPTLTSSLITNNLTSGTPRPVFGPLWDDLDQETFGTFSYKTEGTAPNRVFTAEWLNFAWNYSATTPVISFQLKLYEADGTIAFIYREESGAIAGTPTASIGISAVGTGAGNFLSLDGTGPNPNVSSTIETTTLSTKPVSGQIYSFVTYPFPAISHTPLDNTTSTDARLVSAVITSSVGLAGAPNQPRMYYRIGTSGAYTAVVMTQTLADTWTATIPGQSAGTTVQYYIAAQDTSTPPLVMTAPSGGSGVNPPGSTPPLTPYQYFIIAPLVGGTVYPINGVQNPPVSFSDITNALAYIQACGITGTGQVILELSTGYAGEPAYPVTFLAFPGASATLGVVIRPAVGTSPFTLEGSSGTAIFYLDGVNYLTIDGRPGGTGTSKNIIVSNTSTSAAALRLINGATYNSINYCIFKGVNTSTGGVVYISAGASNKYNLIENCDITAGATFPAYGFYFYGISSDYNKYNIISKCRVYDFSSSGFYFYWYDSSTTIQECDIFTATQQTSTALYGINITGASATYGTKILSNKIHGFNTSGASPTFYGINIQTASPTVAHTIVNNMVSFDEAIVNPTATIYGIREYYSTVGTLYNIYYNTIYIGGTDVTSGFSYGMYRGYQSTSNFNNNIVFNNRTNSTGTGKHYCFYGGNAGTGLVSNNNDFYAPNANGYVGYWTSDRQTLNDWRTATNQDANSVSQNPNFISPSTSPPNLHINAAIATRLESGGIPIAGITTDIDGDVRAGSSKVHNNVQPDIGADEFNGTAIDEVPPVITYVQLDNTPFTTNRTLVARITDFVSGLANDPSRAPRLFYKKGNAGNWLIDTVLTSSGNNWIFTVNHTKLGGVVVGDTVFYFVQATDSSNNTGYNPVGGSTAPYSYQIVMSMSGNYNIGIGQTYPTLRAFFTALNNSAIIGNITGIVTSDITETVSDTLYPLNYFGGVWQVTIQPVAEKTVYTISGALAYPLICLNGADNITFNGMGKNLVFRNTSTSGRIFDFVNDATYNTITSCIIEGCGSSTTYPTIRFTTSTGTLGNSNNIISNNDIRDVSTTGTRHYVAIYSSGTAVAPNNSNTISGNNIFNYSYYGIYVGSTGNGGNWTISGNSLYYNNATALSTGHYAMYFYPGAAANSNIIYGNFIGGSAPNCGGVAYTTSTSFYGIYAYKFGNSAKSYIRKNTIKNISLTNTSSYLFAGIFVYSGTADVDSNTIGDPSYSDRAIPIVKSNNIQNNQPNTDNQKRTANSDIKTDDNGMTLDLAYDQDPPEPNFTTAISNDIVKSELTENSILIAGSSGSYGIYNASSFPITIANNEISNITASGTGTSVSLRGIYAAGTTSCTTFIYNNVVHHLTSASTSTALNNVAALFGIGFWPPTFVPNYGALNNNTVFTLIANNADTMATNVFGLLASNCAFPMMNNKIYDIRNYSTRTNTVTPPTATGLYIRATSGPIVANNMISVGDGQTTNTCFNGIWNAFGTVNYYGLYNNSVLVSGSVASGALPSFAFLRGNYSGTAILTITEGINNIFVNNRSGGTGFHYALGNQATTADSFGWWFDNNILKTTDPATLGLWGSTNLSFNDWKLAHPAGSGGDANSINAEPGYMSVTDLHINPTSLVPNRKAVPIEGLTFDFDNEARHPTNPDIGADEYTPNAPSSFALISPNNGVINQPLNGQLVWHKANLAEYYDVYLDIVNPPLVKMSAMQMDTVYSYADILPNSTYYWKVVAQNDTGISPQDGSVSSAVWSFSTETWDASPTAIIRPLPVSFAGNVITPQVKVKNYGTGMITSFTATMTISTIYVSTKPVTNLMPGDSTVVFFDPWTAVLGTYNMKAWTNLVMDINRDNDTIIGTVDVQPPAHNVGTMYIIAPLDTIVEGTIITPRARIKNYGAYTENFLVRFKIGADYNQAISISNFVSNAETTLAFPNWTAIRCNYLVSCSTECEGDQLPEDDIVSHTITVKYSDIELVSILAPRDTLLSCNDYIPAVIVKNNGVHTYPATCSVMVRILRYPPIMTSFCNVGPATKAVVMYEKWIEVTMAMGEIDTLFFPTYLPYWSDIYWNATPTFHLIQAEVKTSEDLNRANNTAENPFIVKAGANDLQMNWTGLMNGSLPVDYETIPAMTYNAASVVSNSPAGPTARFRVRVNIIRESDNAVVYSRYLDRTLTPMSYACIAFSTGWTPTAPGWYKVKSWIEALPGVDINPENSSWEREYFVTTSVAKTESKSNQSAQNNSSNTPTTFKLIGNNPNPFSNVTKIQWQIPTASNVAITVYDATGKIVKTLVNENMSTGIYNRIWNRTDDNDKKVPAGIYFYEIKANDFTARRKMVITN